MMTTKMARIQKCATALSLLCLLLLIGCGKQDWCEPGKTVTFEKGTATTVGYEEVSGKQLCHFTRTENKVKQDYYLDNAAFGKFLDSKSASVGSGCIQLTIEDTETATNMCFGDMEN